MAVQTKSEFLASIRSIYKSRKSPRISAEDHRIVFQNLADSIPFFRIIRTDQRTYDGWVADGTIDENAAYFITG